MRTILRCAGTMLLLGLAVFATGCSKTLRPQLKPGEFMMNQRFDLTLRERVRLRQLAWSGDGAAAFRLYEYYDLFQRDDDLAIYWCRQAASRDNVDGIMALVNELCVAPWRGEGDEVHYWIKRGYSKARDERDREYLRETEEEIREPEARDSSKQEAK